MIMRTPYISEDVEPIAPRVILEEIAGYTHARLLDSSKMSAEQLSNSLFASCYGDRTPKFDICYVLDKEDKTMGAIRPEHKLYNTIHIQPNKLGDTRSADKLPTYGEFITANDDHRRDVRNVMEELCKIMKEVGFQHDYTKVMHSGEFYRDFCIKLTHPDEEFTDMPWYQGHIKAERHHINADCPEDVDLIDILEHIADCVCAGMARSGEVYPIEISSDILQKAVANTKKLIEDSIKINTVVETEEPDHIEFT